MQRKPVIPQRSRARRTHPQGGAQSRRENKADSGVCGKAPGGRGNRCRGAAALHHGSVGAFLLRGNVFRHVKRGAWTSYTSEDTNLVEVENSYAGLETELATARLTISSVPTPAMTSTAMTLPISGHNPHESASYLTAKYQSYTRAEVQSELQRIFNQQYTLTLTEEVEIRYRPRKNAPTHGNQGKPYGHPYGTSTL